ncbi:MAG: hypothetical protein QME12_09220, partial [Nanoarchaeota archaeon]|nr:hypothetical protein [Nanoarchaeota archaeon]
KDYPDQLKPCEGMCRQKVAFYCSESKQYSPCKDTTYICNGNMQVLPCEIFNCHGGIKQTVPCGLEAFCGENQVAEGKKCKCRAGFHDCDGDGKTCESENPCGIEVETCDDGQDNDNDYLIDCDDRMNCRTGVVCGTGNVCFDGKCLLQEDANVSARCGEGMEYKEGKCKCAEGFVEFEDKCVPLVVKLECKGGFVEVEGKCVPKVEKPEECPEGFEFKGNTCVQKELPVEPNATECPELHIMREGVCVVKAEKCPEGYELEEGQCIAKQKPECPEGYELKGNECAFVGKKIECAGNEVLDSGKCISKDVYEGIEVRPEETGKKCGLVADCGSEQEICSNGFCKRIPDEIYKKEYGGEEAGKIVIVIPEPVFVEPEVVRRAKEEKAEEKQKRAEEQQPSEGITGAFFRWITGFASKEKQCSKDEDCHSNQACDNVMGQCHCKEGWVDCNGRREGNDDDGCESQDLTCGGEREICEGGCNENQFCNEEKGWCECNAGFFDCDGNWINGCESKKQCTACITDDDCSKPVCAPWNNNVIKFGCVQGETWEEENGAVAFAAECKGQPSGVIEPHLMFDSWGNAFAEVNAVRQIYNNEAWCSFELENAVKERKELEKGLNEDFLKWFFDEYLVSEPDKWETRIGGIYDIYWGGLVENAKQTARNSACIGSAPPQYNPIDITYESGFGKVHIWEEMKRF